MKVIFPATRFALWLIVTTCLAAAQTAYAQQKGLAQQHAKKILHEDGTSSESVKDNNKKEITETTYDARGVAISKKIFLLNDNGDPTQGVIYDGAGTVIAKVQFFFDDLGRPIEERCLNLQGQIFRRVIHQYDPAGNALQPQAFDYAVNSPNMKPAPINFTKSTPPPSQNGQSNTQTVQQPGQTPQIMSVSPSTGQVTSSSSAPDSQPEKKKKGLFNFGNKK